VLDRQLDVVNSRLLISRSKQRVLSIKKQAAQPVFLLVRKNQKSFGQVGFGLYTG
jgi:hypothetical protein